MTATRQFLVTLPHYPMPLDPQDEVARAIAHAIWSYGPRSFGAFPEHVQVVPLPDLAADDTDLQIGFRNLSAAARSDQRTIGTIISKEQAAALVAELSKQHPARTSHVDQAALDAALIIQRLVKDKALHTVQKTARMQLAIIDAICRCVPEVVA